jgi:hypothetical protein
VPDVIQIIVLAIVQRPSGAHLQLPTPVERVTIGIKPNARSLAPSTFRESRRSTRVPLKVVISVEGSIDCPACEGETTVVNLHGARSQRPSRCAAG